MKKASIIIPVYNGSNYLKEAIDSALIQTYKNIEIIVVNDGSNDDGATEKIATLYGDKICYYNKKNGGVASALNYGIEKMTGEYFSWLSHDDLYEKTKIEDQIKVMDRYNSDSVVVACNSRILFANGIKKKEYIDKKTFEYFDIFLATSAGVGVNGCSLLIPKKVLVENHGFNENLPVTQDYDLWFRLKDKCKFVLLEKNLVIYRRHDQQDSVQKQKLCQEAGDQLHFDFLNEISYERFEKYFSDKTNINHAWKNYKLYKSKGFNKTTSMMLKLFLKYYYENDINKFYDTFLSEVNSEEDFKCNKKMISLEYEKLLDSDEINNLIKKLDTDNLNSEIRKKESLFKKLISSISSDGVGLTIEKGVRKIYSKIKSKKS